MMLTSLSLRLRIFLIFLGAAASCSAIFGVSLFIAYNRMSGSDVASAFVAAGVLAVLGTMAVTAVIWLLFDENVAKPIDRIAATVRTSAFADVVADFDLHEARYLGDLAPAVHAVTGKLSKVTASADEIVATETSRLMAERAGLALLLTEIPVAIVLVSPKHLVMLYDGQAASVLSQVHVPRLSASIFDYFLEEDLRNAHAQLDDLRTEIEAEVRGTRGNLSFVLRLKRLSQATGYMILIDSTKARIGPEATRPLTFDFDLTERDGERAIENRPLRDLDFVVFDTETTGLMPNKDELVQIGAIRVVNGRIITGETMDQLIHPGRKIPPASTRVHGISDEMVANAPDAATAVSSFHEFATGSVLVAHNAPFDMAFLQRHGKALGLSWDHPILDTVLLSAVLYGATEKHTLDALCERLRISIPDDLRHTALGDAQATAEALCKMLPILASRGFSTFGDVVKETRRHGRLLKDLN